MPERPETSAAPMSCRDTASDTAVGGETAPAALMPLVDRTRQATVGGGCGQGPGAFQSCPGLCGEKASSCAKKQA